MAEANLVDIIGKRFGKLVVTSFSNTNTSQHKDRLRVNYWFNCQCDCGKTTIVKKSCLNLSKSGTKSCGCASIDGWEVSACKQRGVPRPHVQKPNGESVLHTSFLSYKIGAKRRNISFQIDETKFAELTSQNCHYCGTEPKDLKPKKDSFATRKMNGVDRVNSDIGYEQHNCVSCCKICNYMKQELSKKEFYSHITKILNFRRSGEY